MSHTPSEALAKRHRTIRAELSARSLDALVVTSLPNILYLTNFTGSSAIAVLTMDRVLFVTDFRYVTAMRDAGAGAFACPDLEMAIVEGSYDATLARLLETRAGKRIGFEAAHVTVSRHAWLTGSLARAEKPLELCGTEGIVERARVRKDDYELATLREAGRRLSSVAREVLHDVAAGRSERDVAHGIDRRILQGGFERPAFDTIVAGG